jgi:glutathione S-transferase
VRDNRRVPPGNVLITIPISHYCEKARWALDHAGIAFTERAHLQMIHRVVVRRAGGGTTVPVLVCDEGVLGESEAIIRYADRRGPAERSLFPARLKEEIAALEAGFDNGLGPAGRLWMYFELRGRGDVAAAYACTGVPAWQRRAFPLAYPLVIRLIDRYLKITPVAAAAAASEVGATFDRVAERLADGRPYLLGDRFTAADLTFAALAAAVLMPPGYRVPLPQPHELPLAMGTRVREWRAHPAGAHALRMFREHRR